jgi:hypothetical protein
MSPKLQKWKEYLTVIKESEFIRVGDDLKPFGQTFGNSHTHKAELVAKSAFVIMDWPDVFCPVILGPQCTISFLV